MTVETRAKEYLLVVPKERKSICVQVTCYVSRARPVSPASRLRLGARDEVPVRRAPRPRLYCAPKGHRAGARLRQRHVREGAPRRAARPEVRELVTVPRAGNGLPQSQ